jgi:hypothetical protein
VSFFGIFTSIQGGYNNMHIFMYGVIAYGSYKAIQAVFDSVTITRDKKPIIALIIAYMAFCALYSGIY